jgi:hypothetical protein
MGRPRKSEIEKKRAGNPGKRDVLPDPELEVIRDVTPPGDMPKNQHRYWNLYAPYMVKNNRLTDLNRTDLERLCYFEAQVDAINQMLITEVPSLLQEKKNYHGDVVDLVEGVYSKLSRNYTEVVRRLKADLRLRTDKVVFRVKPEKKSKFEGLIGGKKEKQ